jgi:signal transduction histidine kinase
MTRLASDLMVRLQNLTEALAGARTQAEVLQIILEPALEALGAVAGSVMLLSADRQRLDLAQFEDHTPGTASSIWQSGPLSHSTPATDTLKRREPLFFERAGDLVAAYLELEAQTGGQAAVATAALPMILNGQVLGVLILDFPDPHPFPPEELYFLRTLASQVATSLGRVQLLSGLEQQVSERTAALDTFVWFTEVADSETDVLTLARKAGEVLSRLFPGATNGYYELDDGRWKVRVHTDDLNDDLALLAVITEGLPAETPVFVQAMQSGEAVFVDNWNAGAQQFLGTEAYRQVALYPLRNGKRPAVFAFGHRGGEWNSGTQAIFRSLGRSLSLALERSALARSLQAQNAELEARTRALEAVAALSTGFSLGADDYELVRRAQQVALSLVPSGFAVYYELARERWWVRAQVGEMRSPELQRVVDEGLEYAATQSLLRPWTSGEPYFQDQYDEGGDGLADLTRLVRATATIPLWVGQERLGVFAVVLFDERDWSATDRVVLETIVRNLGLAIEGARGVRALAQRSRELDEERAAQRAFTAFTEQVGTETDVLVLVGQAFKVLRANFTDFSSAYYEVHDGLWKALVWTDEMTEEQIAMIRAGLPLDVPSFAEALSTRQPVFIDGWNAECEQIPGTDVFGPVCIYPLVVGGQVRGLFTVGLRIGEQWQEQDRAIMRALGRGLALAAERTEQTRVLEHQRDVLDQRTQLLTAANEDMEAFAYTVSHDLRTPVRHVQGFTGLLRKALADEAHLGADTRPQTERYLSVIEDATARMHLLIDAVLDLSRSSRTPLRLGPVDLGALVADVRAELSAETAERALTWTIGPLPVVTGDRDTLRQVMANLLGNAVKYTRQRRDARIEVWAEEQGAHWLISVRDNGAGFDSHYKDRLFGVFQRLHSERDFEGSGIGLATVKRIVLKHEGQVYAEGRPGEGATFGFSLPRTD